MTPNTKRKLKKACWYLAVIALIVVGVIIAITMRTASVLALGLVLLFVLAYLDSNREFYPDNEWKMGQNGVRRRLTGAGSHASLEIDPVDKLTEYLRARASQQPPTSL